MKNKTDAGRDQRVVLNLSLEQAKELNNFLKAKSSLLIGKEIETINKISKRIQKTLNKHESSGKKELSCRDNFATQQEAIEIIEAAKTIVGMAEEGEFERPESEFEQDFGDAQAEVAEACAIEEGTVKYEGGN